MLPQLSKQSDGKSQEASFLAALLSYCRSSEEHEKQRASENACPNQQDRKPKDIEFHGASLRPEADANLNGAAVTCCRMYRDLIESNDASSAPLAFDSTLAVNFAKCEGTQS
jgi:hypothetical protein